MTGGKVMHNQSYAPTVDAEAFERDGKYKIAK